MPEAVLARTAVDRVLPLEEVPGFLGGLSVSEGKET
jgi:hypothetical protein